MTDFNFQSRLLDLTNEIVELHEKRPTASRAYHQARSDAFNRAVQKGTSLTAAREYADSEVIQLRFILDTIDAELAALSEERDHLRFVVTHLL